VEEEIGDDTAKGQNVTTFAVDPSSGTTEAAPENSPPPVDHVLRVTIAIAPLGPMPPLTSELATTSTLGTKLVPRVLRKNVVSIKKSAL
jgi:hypothetical protein